MQARVIRVANGDLPTVMIETGQLAGFEVRDKYGQLLAHVRLEPSHSLNKWLLANGFAVHENYGTASMYKMAYKRIKANTQAQLLRLWGMCSYPTCKM